MKRFTVAFVAISGCVLGPACQMVVGIGDRIEATGDGVGGTDGATPPNGNDGSPIDAGPDVYVEPSKNCPPGCLPPAPPGWTGPSATYDGAETGKPTDCPATYTNKELSVHNGDIIAAPTTCDCGAFGIKGRSCSASVVTWNQVGCPGVGAKQGTATIDFACFEFVDMGLSFKLGTPVLTPGTCLFPNATATTVPEEYTKAQVACGLPQTSECATKATECITAPPPASPFTRLCIHKDGDQTCPSKDYEQRFVAYKNIDDKRTCTTCTATPTGGACQNNFGTRASQAQCNDLPVLTDKTVNTCYNHPGMGAVVDIEGIRATPATCTPTGGTPTGDVKFIEPVTFCCNQ